MVEQENETKIKNLKLEKRKNRTNSKNRGKIKNKESRLEMKQNEIIILTRISCQLMVVC